MVGRFNVPQGDANNWVATDDLFVVGNGTGNAPEQRSNALAVKKNGDTTVAGAIHVRGNGDNIIEGPLHVNHPGESTVAGTLHVAGAGGSTVDGDLKVRGVLRVMLPAGDLDMGDFRAVPQP